jgi:hypothetical protein
MGWIGTAVLSVEIVGGAVALEWHLQVRHSVHSGGSSVDVYDSPGCIGDDYALSDLVKDSCTASCPGFRSKHHWLS